MRKLARKTDEYLSEVLGRHYVPVRKLEARVTDCSHPKLDEKLGIAA